MHRYVERVVDLLDPSLNVLHGMTEDQARARVLSADPAAVRAMAIEYGAALDALPVGSAAYRGEFEAARKPADTLPVLLSLVETFRDNLEQPAAAPTSN